MFPRSWTERIQDILDAISEIETFTHGMAFDALRNDPKTIRAVELDFIIIIIRDCSRATGFIQHVQDGGMQGCVDGLQLGLHATYPRQDAHGSALASAPDRHAFASCESVGSPVLPHARSKAVPCRQA